MVVGYIGKTINLQCANITSNQDIIWLYSVNGTNLLQIDNTQPVKYTIDSNNSLTVLNLDDSDKGYYACGFVVPDINKFISYSEYNLVVESI